jgi:hypothetical protein
MNTQAQPLIPIGTRVTHWDGSRGTHGKGTIIAYNGISASNYVRTNFKEAVELAAKAGLLGGLVNSMYDGTRYPYVVQFDPREPYEGETEHCKEMRLEYPRGYKDVYGVEDTRPIEPFESIFPNDEVLHMARRWHEKLQEWSPWEVISAETYQIIGPGLSNTAEWQRCSRAG